MPDKPLWLDRLPEVISALERWPVPWVERQTIETLLGVRRRRAQQILAPLAESRRGCGSIVDRNALLRHLRQIASGQSAFYEQKRRERLWNTVRQERKRWMETPPAFVEASPEMLRSVYQKDFDGLPAGVELSPGQILVRFGNPDEALQKLLALALAIGKNRDTFDERVQTSEPPPEELPI